jgi:hypothetical protein
MAELTLSQINGRFKLLDRPAALPGKCAVCGAVDKPVVDIGLDLDFYGVVYFCVECMKAAAEILGMVDGALLTRAELVQRHHHHQLEAAKDITDEYVARFAAVSDEFANRLRSLRNSTDEVHEELPDSDSEGELGDSAVADREDGRDSSEDNLTPGNEGPASLSSSSVDGPGPIFSV